MTRLDQLPRLNLNQLRRELGSRRLSTIGGRRALQKRLRAPLQQEAARGRALRDGDVAVPTAVSTGRSTVVQIAVGADFTLALDSLAQVWAWGANTHGQLGQGDLAPRAEPTQVVSLRTRDKVVRIAAGVHHAAATTASGALWAWGSNECGQLGLGDTQLRTAPHHVRGERDEIVRMGIAFTHVTCAERQTVAITVQGEVWDIGGHLSASDTVRAEQERGVSSMAASALGDADAFGANAPPFRVSPQPMAAEVQGMIGCAAEGVACAYAKGLALTAVTYARLDSMNERTAAEAGARLKQMRGAARSGPARERQVLRTQARRLLADAGAPGALFPQSEADIARAESAMYGMAPELDEDDLEGLSDIELLTLVTQLQDGQGPALARASPSPQRRARSPQRGASPRASSPRGAARRSASPAQHDLRERGWNGTTKLASSGGTAAARAAAAGLVGSSKADDVVELLRQALSPAQWAALTIVDKQALARAHGIHMSAIDRIQSDVASQFSGVASPQRARQQGRMKRVNAALASLFRAYRRNGRLAEDCFDYTDDGALAPTEIARGLKRLGIFATTPQLDRLFDALGMSEADTIERHAFIAMLPRELRGSARPGASSTQSRATNAEQP